MWIQNETKRHGTPHFIGETEIAQCRIYEKMSTFEKCEFRKMNYPGIGGEENKRVEEVLKSEMAE